MDKVPVLPQITYEQFVTEHLGQLESQLSKGSYDIHERTLKQFRDVCKPKDLTVIDFQMLEKFRTSRVKDKVSPATVNKYLRTLQSILERAVKRNYIAINPFKGNRKALWVPEPEPTPRILEREDFTALFEACRDDTWRAVCVMGYYTGLRCGEMVALEWDDIDFEAAEIQIRNKADHATKSRRNRTVPMSSHVMKALGALKAGKLPRGPVLRNEIGGRVLNNFQRSFGNLVKRAGLVDENSDPLFTAHDLRRSCATEMLRRGVSPKTVQEILGHADLATTMKYYIAVTNKDKHDAIARLERKA